jgi:amidase
VLSAAGGAAGAGLVGVAAWQSGVLHFLRDAVGPDRPDPVQPTAVPGTPPSARIDVTPTSPPFAAGDMLEEASVSDLRRHLDQRAFSVVELTQASLDRIAAMDRQGPELGAVIEINPDALDIAARLDQDAREGRVRGPLHGIPVLVKDIFATDDQMRTSAGSLALAENPVGRDAFLISRLRDAGAVLIGKTNLTEFSNFKGNGGASGWSARGGQTRNPYALSQSAWGSSTGSAVAVAASYVPLAIGAETDGSILCPAAACGVVGIKPTVGLVSRRGGVLISYTQDSPGPMTRSVEDAALLLNAIAGHDAEDWAYGEFAGYAPAAWVGGTPVPGSGAIDYTRALDPNGLKGARIGVCRSLFGFDLNSDALMESAIAAMAEAGAEIVDELYAGAVEQLAGADLFTVLVTEFAHGIEQFITDYMPDGPIASLADIVGYNNDHADRELLYGDQQGLEAALDVGTVWDEHYHNALHANLSLARDEGIDALMDEHRLDALIAPTAGIPTPLDPYGDVFMGSSALLAAVAGFPSITVPIGQYNALPAGMHLFGRAFSEETLIRLAYGLEQTLQAREAPTYLEEPPMGIVWPTVEEEPAEEFSPADEGGGEWVPTDDSEWIPADESGGEWAPPDGGEGEWLPPGE